MQTATPHRLRCVTVKNGCVNACPSCGHLTLTDWEFDMARDPLPDDGPITIDGAEAVQTLRDMGSSVALPCADCA